MGQAAHKNRIERDFGLAALLYSAANPKRLIRDIFMQLNAVAQRTLL